MTHMEPMMQSVGLDLLKDGHRREYEEEEEAEEGGKHSEWDLMMSNVPCFLDVIIEGQSMKINSYLWCLQSRPFANLIRGMIPFESNQHKKEQQKNDDDKDEEDDPNLTKVLDLTELYGITVNAFTFIDEVLSLRHLTSDSQGYFEWDWCSEEGKYYLKKNRRNRIGGIRRKKKRDSLRSIIEEQESTVYNILTVAEKLELPRLIQVCVSWICRCIDVRCSQHPIHQDDSSLMMMMEEDDHGRDDGESEQNQLTVIKSRTFGKSSLEMKMGIVDIIEGMQKHGLSEEMILDILRKCSVLGRQKSLKQSKQRRKELINRREQSDENIIDDQPSDEDDCDEQRGQSSLLTRGSALLFLECKEDEQLTKVPLFVMKALIQRDDIISVVASDRVCRQKNGAELIGNQNDLIRNDDRWIPMCPNPRYDSQRDPLLVDEFVVWQKCWQWSQAQAHRDHQQSSINRLVSSVIEDVKSEMVDPQTRVVSNDSVPFSDSPALSSSVVAVTAVNDDHHSDEVDPPTERMSDERIIEDGMRDQETFEDGEQSQHGGGSDSEYRDADNSLSDDDDEEDDHHGHGDLDVGLIDNTAEKNVSVDHPSIPECAVHLEDESSDVIANQSKENGNESGSPIIESEMDVMQLSRIYMRKLVPFIRFKEMSLYFLGTQVRKSGVLSDAEFAALIGFYAGDDHFDLILSQFWDERVSKLGPRDVIAASIVEEEEKEEDNSVPLWLISDNDDDDDYEESEEEKRKSEHWTVQNKGLIPPSMITADGTSGLNLKESEDEESADDEEEESESESDVRNESNPRWLSAISRRCASNARLFKVNDCGLLKLDFTMESNILESSSMIDSSDRKSLKSSESGFIEDSFRVLFDTSFVLDRPLLIEDSLAPSMDDFYYLGRFVKPPRKTHCLLAQCVTDLNVDAMRKERFSVALGFDHRRLLGCLMDESSSSSQSSSSSVVVAKEQAVKCIRDGQFIVRFDVENFHSDEEGWEWQCRWTNDVLVFDNQVRRGESGIWTARVKRSDLSVGPNSSSLSKAVAKQNDHDLNQESNLAVKMTVAVKILPEQTAVVIRMQIIQNVVNMDDSMIQRILFDRSDDYLVPRDGQYNLDRKKISAVEWVPLMGIRQRIDSEERDIEPPTPKSLNVSFSTIDLLLLQNDNEPSISSSSSPSLSHRPPMSRVSVPSATPVIANHPRHSLAKPPTSLFTDRPQSDHPQITATAIIRDGTDDLESLPQTPPLGAEMPHSYQPWSSSPASRMSGSVTDVSVAPLKSVDSKEAKGRSAVGSFGVGMEVHHQPYTQPPLGVPAMKMPNRRDQKRPVSIGSSPMSKDDEKEVGSMRVNENRDSTTDTESLVSSHHPRAVSAMSSSSSHSELSLPMSVSEMRDLTEISASTFTEYNIVMKPPQKSGLVTHNGRDIKIVANDAKTVVLGSNVCCIVNLPHLYRFSLRLRLEELRPNGFSVGFVSDVSEFTRKGSYLMKKGMKGISASMTLEKSQSMKVPCPVYIGHKRWTKKEKVFIGKIDGWVISELDCRDQSDCRIRFSIDGSLVANIPLSRVLKKHPSVKQLWPALDCDKHALIEFKQ